MLKAVFAFKEETYSIFAIAEHLWVFFGRGKNAR